MKIYVPIILILVNCITMQTKAQIHLQGKVVDENKKGIEFVRIEILNDSNNKKNYFTDSNGNFRLKNVQKNKNIFRISIINYKTLDTIIENSNDFLLFTLVKDTQTLQAIEVNNTKSKIKREGKNIIFYPGANIIGTGVEVLKKVPLLSVEKDNLSMFAKNGVIIYLNGKRLNMPQKALLNYLKLFKASDIIKIEVTHLNLPENDANSKLGTINIVTKKIHQNSWLINIFNSYQQNEYPYFSNGFNVLHKTPKFMFNLSGNTTDYTTRPTRNQKINFTNEIWDIQGFNINNGNYKNINAGLEYSPTKKLTISGNFNKDLDNSENNLWDETNVFSNNSVLKQHISTTSKSTSVAETNSFNFSAQFLLDSLNKSLTFIADKLMYNVENNQHLNTIYTNIIDYSLLPNFLFLSKNYQDAIVQTAQITLSLPFKKNKFSFGGKYSNSDIHNNNYFYNYYNNVLDKMQPTDDIFSYKEITNAIFSSFSKSIKKWSFFVGARIENTSLQGYQQLNTIQIKNEYTNLFPSINISYNINDNNSISYEYSKRIERPNFYQLNPFKRFTNTNSIVNGNPFLLPYFYNTNNITFIHNSNLYLMLYNINASQVINEYTTYNDTSKIQYTTLYNFQRYNSTSLSYYHDMYFLDEKLNITPKVVLTYFEQYSDFVALKNKTSIFTGNAQFYVGYTFKKAHNLQVYTNINYNLPTINGIFETSANYRIDIGLQKQLYKNKLSLSISFNDIFRTELIKRTVNYNNIKDERTRYYNAQSVYISLSWNFNKGKRIEKKDKKISNEEELKRVK